MEKLIKSFIKKCIWCGIVTFIIRLFVIHNIMIDSFSIFTLSFYDYWSLAGESILLTILIMSIYERWLWKFNPFENIKKLFNFYEGDLISTYDNKHRKIQLNITQTLLSIKIILISDESKSTSISATINNESGENQLIFCYLNEPIAKVRDRSEIHYGTAVLYIDNPKKISGQYYTDRKTTGDINVFAIEK